MSFLWSQASGSSKVITSGLISFSFPFTTSPPREGRKALQGHSARTRDGSRLLSLFSFQLLPTPLSHFWAERCPAREGQGRGGFLIKMLSAPLACNRHPAGARRGPAWGAGCGAGSRGCESPRGSREAADSPGNPRRVLRGNELPGPR